jgi:hypothetical protein
MTIATKTDLGTDGWMIDDEIVRLREWASDRSHPLPSDPSAEVTIGSSEACSLQLSDPSGRLSRQHARLARDGNRWTVRDLDSKNGLRLDGTRRPKALLEPGSELGLGGITLIAESHRLIALREFLARLLGWSDDRSEAVDLALRSIRLSATRRAALALCGEGDLIPIARGLHRYSLSAERPFVLCDPRRRPTDEHAALENYTSAMSALRAAAGGSICVWPKRLPRDFAELTAALRDPSVRVQLIACGQRPSDRTDLVSAPIEIPPLSTRADELERVIDEYASEAGELLGIEQTFSEVDRDWVLRNSAASLPDIEKGTLRLVALRDSGNVARAATKLGMAHASLGEWIGRRRLPWASMK